MKFAVLYYSLFQVVLGQEKKADDRRLVSPCDGQWSYKVNEELRTPEEWPDVSCINECHGKRQSPIDLPIIGRNFDEEANIVFGWSYGSTGTWVKPRERAEKLGYLRQEWHSLDSKMYVKVNTVELGRCETFFLKSFAMHFPSEHTIGGRHFDGEIQFFHSHPYGTKHLTLAVLIEIIQDARKVSPFSKVIFGVNGSQFSSGNMSSNNFAKLYTEVTDPMRGKFFYYYGSLTVPLCDENISWVVLENTLKVSRDTKTLYEENNINTDYEAGVGMYGSARPTQPLYGRRVEYGGIQPALDTAFCEIEIINNASNISIGFLAVAAFMFTM